MKRKKLILVSLDALSSTDFEYVKKLPNFSKIIRTGTYCTNVDSVYPSLTFPSHASIVTGCNPSTHGIVNNYMFLPFEKIPKWNFYASNIKRPAIWDYAQESKKEVLSMSWPVSAGAKMKYSMPEMSPAKPKVWNADSFFRQMQVLCRYGTPVFALKTFLADRRLPKAWFLGKQPQLDISMMRSFLWQINRCTFDIGLLHIYGLDDVKHVEGIHAKGCQQFLGLYDKFIGRLMEYAQSRPEENITLLFTGDHSQKKVSYAIYGNRVLEGLGYCKYENEILKSYEAYLDSCDGMAYIYLKDSNKKHVIEAVKQAFSKNPGVERMMEPEEFANLGCDKQADLVLEAKAGYYFESGYDSQVDEYGIKNSHYLGVHGYLPDGVDYQTMVFCYGEDVSATCVEHMSITDILPTVCQWMNMNIREVDGVARREFWKNSKEELL